MFSALVHHPRGAIVLQQKGAPPPGLDNNFDAMQKQHTAITMRQKAESDPTGRDYLVKHLYRPRVPYAPGLANTTMVKLARTEPDVVVPRTIAPSTRTVYVQTDYRCAIVLYSFLLY
jgi:hypothetical protein